MEDAWTFLTTNFSETRLWIATSLLHTGVFVILNLVLYFIAKYSLFDSYRIQQVTPPEPLLREAFWEVFRKHFIVGPISFIMLTPLARWTQIIDKIDPTKTPNTELPSFREVGLQILLFILIQDTIFYWSHRALHLPIFYKRIHKKHHRFHTNVGIASEFAHPVEDLLNTIAMMVGPFLVGCHLLTLWVWFFVRIWETVEAHSGYAFPFPFGIFAPFGVAERHDFHHSQNRGCYGSFFGMWDWLMGTDHTYKAWVQAGANDPKRDTKARLTKEKAS